MLKTHFTNAYNKVLKIKGKKKYTFLQTNKTILQPTEEFVQMLNEVLNSVNVLIQVHNIFESQDLTQEPSLISTNVSSVTQTQAINSTIQNNTNRLKEMIMNLQKQSNALKNNLKQNNSEQKNQVTIQGKCNQSNTSKYSWSYGACVHSSENCRNIKDGYENSATFEMGGSLDFCHKSK